ncbi:MAG TPA: sugar transferase [Caldisericia bacterium]|nr:sugar transferase [Caldisericia bacterium]
MTKQQKQYVFYIKPTIDFVLSLIGIIVLLPVYVLISIAIKIDSPGPILFKQKRIGIHKTTFYILKSRTMKSDAPSNIPTHLLQNPDYYITRIGRILRKSSLDEIPQIWNVLLGQMSVIGPRPALWNQFDLIEERDKYGVNAIKPGLTGWAQINGRDELPIQIKVSFDFQYMKKIGIKIDLLCFTKTLVSVIKSDGVVEGKKESKGLFIL